MTNLTRMTLLWILLLLVFLVNGQNNITNKKIILPTGSITLKSALNAISTQTGCIFSYDPTKISDNQSIKITSKTNLSLDATLNEILPKNVQYKLNGKYIVLQRVSVSSSLTSKTKQEKASIQNTKLDGKINKSATLERLVLPPLVDTTISQLDQQKADSVVIIENSNPIEPKDTILVTTVIEDTLSNRLDLAPEIQKIDSTKISKSGFGNFIKKNGFLVMGISFNNQLAALSVRAGLSNIYSIVSIGSDYNDSYLLGVGVGVNIKIDKYFSVNFDLLQNSLIAGKSYLLQVRASNTQFIPVLNYSIGSSFKIFAGPSINLIKSSYVSTISTTDLGLLVGIGYSVGVKVDLKNLLFKKNS